MKVSCVLALVLLYYLFTEIRKWRHTCKLEAINLIKRRLLTYLRAENGSDKPRDIGAEILRLMDKHSIVFQEIELTSMIDLENIIIDSEEKYRKFSKAHKLGFKGLMLYPTVE